MSMTATEALEAANRLQTAADVRRDNNGGFHDHASAAMANKAAELRQQSNDALTDAANADLFSQPVGGLHAQHEHDRAQGDALAAAAPAQLAEADKIAARVFAHVKGGTSGGYATSTAALVERFDAGDEAAGYELSARAEAGDTAAWNAIMLP